VVRSLVLCVMFCRSLFVPLPFLAIVSSALRFTDSDYLFGILKLSMLNDCRNHRICKFESTKRIQHKGD